MRPRKFFEIRFHTDHGIKQAHEVFANPDKLTVTPKDIEIMAQTLADSLRRRLAKMEDTAKPVTLIIEALQPEQILDGVFLE